MSVTEHIMAMIMIIMAIMVGSVLFISHYTDTMIKKEKFVNQASLEDRYSSVLNSVLHTTEPKSKRTFGDLMGSTAYYRNTLLFTKVGRLIRIDEEFQKLLDIMLVDNYYFEVDSPIENIEMIFVVVGTDQISQDSETLANNMDQVLTEIKQSLKMDVSAEAYILDIPNSSKCMNYPIPCQYIDKNFIYFNKSYDQFNLEKYRYEIMPPPHLDESDDIWRSDWETAISSIIIKDNLPDLSTLVVFVPLMRSLPGATTFLHPCPTEYAASILLRDRDILIEYNVVVNPIFSLNIDPVLYCHDEVLIQLESLIKYTHGTILYNRDNFVRKLSDIPANIIEQSTFKLGKKLPGERYVISAKVPMPNGKYTDARLYTFLDGIQ